MAVSLGFGPPVADQAGEGRKGRHSPAVGQTGGPCVTRELYSNCTVLRTVLGVPSRPVPKLAEPHILSACPACGARVRLLTRRTSGTCFPEGEGHRPLFRGRLVPSAVTPHVPFLFGEVSLVVCCTNLSQRACLGLRAACVPVLPTLCIGGISVTSGYGIWSRGENKHTNDQQDRGERPAERQPRHEEEPSSVVATRPSQEQGAARGDSTAGRGR